LIREVEVEELLVLFVQIVSPVEDVVHSSAAVSALDFWRVPMSRRSEDDGNLIVITDQ